MKLIFAQGNPGNDYTRTRHNVGFMVLDALAARQNLTWKKSRHAAAETAETTLAGEKVLLIKPTSFYNETGSVAQRLLRYHKLTPDALLVIHDELALPFGTLRARSSGQDAGNNGIKSLNAHIGEQYARIRIGVGNDLRQQMGDSDFVLGRFSAEETNALVASVIPRAIELVEAFVAERLEHTSHTV